MPPLAYGFLRNLGIGVDGKGKCKEVVRGRTQILLDPGLHSIEKMNKIPTQANPYLTLNKYFEISTFSRGCGQQL